MCVERMFELECWYVTGPLCGFPPALSSSVEKRSAMCFAIPTRAPHPVCLEVACAAHLQVPWKGLGWSILAICICLDFLYRILMCSEVQVCSTESSRFKQCSWCFVGKIMIMQKILSLFFLDCLNFPWKYELCLQIVRWFLVIGLHASYSTPSILLNFSIRGDPIRG